MNTAKMQAARANKTLNILTRYEGEVMTRKEFLYKKRNEGYISEIGEKSLITYSRIKSNRMSSYEEQKEYMRKCNTMTEEYKIKKLGDSEFWAVTKTEYIYFNTLPPI